MPHRCPGHRRSPARACPPTTSWADYTSRSRARCEDAAAMNLADLDATAQAELVRSGNATPRELVDAALARIERDNPALGAFIATRGDAARAEADAAPHGPFRGVPIAIKDICATVAGMPQTAGMLPLKRAGITAAIDS